MNSGAARLMVRLSVSESNSSRLCKLAHARLRELRHAQCHVHCTSAMASNVCTVGNSSFHRVEPPTAQGTNILVVKGTAHTRLKEVRAIATVIALASFDVGRLRRRKKERFSRFLAVSLAIRFSHLEGTIRLKDVGIG